MSEEDDAYLFGGEGPIDREIEALERELGIWSHDFEREAKAIDDYLWDKRSPIDPIVAEVESALAGFAYHRTVRAEKPLRRGRLLVAAAGLLLLFGTMALVWSRRADHDALRNERTAEAPASVDAQNGLVVEVGARSAVGRRIVVGRKGFVDAEPGALVRVIDHDDEKSELFLDRGAITASISARPRTFSIGTPAGLTVDLGCRYRVEVLEHGRTWVKVLTGQVAFETEGRKVFVPHGAGTYSVPGRGPGAPFWDEEVSSAYRDALDVVEFSESPPEELVRRVIRESRTKDGLTLWHLLSARTEHVRRESLERLLVLCPPSPALDEARLRALHRPSLEDWKEEMRWAYWY